MCNKKSMKRSIVKAFGMLSIASFALCSFSTVSNSDAELVCNGNVLVCDSVNAYDSVEQVPEFPGGMQEMFKYMAMNVKYPQVARDINAQGTKYNGSGCLIHGSAVVGDSFVAVERLVKERPEDAESLNMFRHIINDHFTIMLFH